ncbi:MAG: transketolase [Ruminococcus sp.]|nr:transketolase [Ruminococcus sp.]
MRSTFVKVLDKIAEKDEKVICVIGDTGYSVFEDFEKKYKERFVNIGIAEQNFVSFGAGLAAMGMKPFIYNVVSFMTYRAFEQIELDICFQENPVVLVGVGGGHAYGPAGPTHHGYFDISLMTSLPNMTVICPGDPIEMEAAMYAAYNMNSPVYIRIGRSVDPLVHSSQIDFTKSRYLEIHKGKDVALLVTGTMLKDAVKIVDDLKKSGINISLYSVPFVKPIDEELIIKCSESYDYIFTLEEHSINGGLGTAVGNVILEKNLSVRLHKFGFPDMFAPVTGSREYLNKLYGIDSDSVVNTIKSLVYGE